MHNKSPMPVKWAGECSSLARALLLEVSTWCHRELYLCLIFLTTTPPTLKKRHTHIQTDFGVTHHSLFPSPTPTLSSLSPPLPTQACDVTVSDKWGENFIAPVCEDDSDSALCAASLVLGALCWLLWVPRIYRQLSRSSSNALQSGRSRVDLRMTSREWQCLSQPTPTATCQSQRHKGIQAAPALLACRKYSFGRGIYIQEGGSALCVFYMNTGG